MDKYGKYLYEENSIYNDRTSTLKEVLVFHLLERHPIAGMRWMGTKGSHFKLMPGYFQHDDHFNSEKLKINTEYLSETELTFIKLISKYYRSSNFSNGDRIDTIEITLDKNKIKELGLTFKRVKALNNYNTTFQVWKAISLTYKYKNQFLILENDEIAIEVFPNSNEEIENNFKLLEFVCESNLMRSCIQTVNFLNKNLYETLEKEQQNYFENLKKQGDLYIIEINPDKVEFRPIIEGQGLGFNYYDEYDKIFEKNITVEGTYIIKPTNKKIPTFFIKGITSYSDPEVNVNNIVYGPQLLENCESWIMENEDKFIHQHKDNTSKLDETIQDSSFSLITCPYCGGKAMEYDSFSICHNCDAKWM